VDTTLLLIVLICSIHPVSWPVAILISVLYCFNEGKT
jgi:hypothetical protein